MQKCIPTPVIVFLFTLFIVLTSCNGQGKVNIKGSSKNDQERSRTEGNQKLFKTQGTDQFVITRCGMQDNTGNLWFGTSGEGIYRYDGNHFTQFTVEHGLNSNKVWSVLEDSSGTIWVGTTDGVCRFDGQKFIRIPIHENFGPSTSSNDYFNDWSTKKTVWCMLEDRSGKIWFGTGDGVYCYHHNALTRFLDDPNVINTERLHLKMVGDILEDKDGNIWLASGMLPGQEGLCRFDGKTITRFNPGGDGWIRSILEDHEGVIWSSGRHHGNWYFDGSTFTKFTEKEGIGAPLLVDQKGQIWFSGEEQPNGYEGSGGIWCYDGKEFTNYTSEDGIGQYSVWSMVEDRLGNIWFGTRNSGLYKYDGKTFTNYTE